MPLVLAAAVSLLIAVAKELRAFGLGGFLRERYDRLYDEHMAELRKVARRRLRVSLLGNLATTVVLAGIVAALLVLALNGRIGLADAGRPPGSCSCSASG